MWGNVEKPYKTPYEREDDTFGSLAELKRSNDLTACSNIQSVSVSAEKFNIIFQATCNIADCAFHDSFFQCVNSFWTFFYWLPVRLNYKK